MYGLIAKITTIPGKRDEMIALLKTSAAGVPGCLSYVVANDSAVRASFVSALLKPACVIWLLVR
jgi:quinol monooxygenase YgiN